VEKNKKFQNMLERVKDNMTIKISNLIMICKMKKLKINFNYIIIITNLLNNITGKNNYLNYKLFNENI
jgi:hypothetical protein